jgi:Protein of unknown function (DUF1360)
VTEAVEQAVEGYADRERPLGPYLGIAGVFAGTFGALLLSAERSNRLPPRLGVGDLALAGVATYKLSRLLSKDKVTSFLRAPFTEYQKPGGRGEVEEKPRGHGWRLALGELLVCPYCLGLWVAGAFTSGLVFAPRSTRVVASSFAILAVSDFLQLASKAAEDRSQST